MCCRWLGDAASVSAKAKIVVKFRTDAETGEPTAVRIPDHLDILVSECTDSKRTACLGGNSSALLLTRSLQMPLRHIIVVAVRVSKMPGLQADLAIGAQAHFVFSNVIGTAASLVIALHTTTQFIDQQPCHSKV
jgi:hypothetical protein